MKLTLGLVVLFFAAIRCFASEAPPAVGGMIYYESGRSIARTSYWLGIALQPDGSARGLFFLSTRPGLSGPSITSGTSVGVWTYAKRSDGTAQLTIRTEGGGRPFAAERTLSFTADDRGTAVFDSSLAYFNVAFFLADPSVAPPLVNCSNRSYVPAGGKAFTGFVVTGDRPRPVLVRAVGPGLSAFGINDYLGDPQLVVARGAVVFSQNADWEPIGGGSIRATGAYVGAFPLPPGSKDAAVVAVLPPGDYVTEVSGASPTDAGQALIEVYVLP